MGTAGNAEGGMANPAVSAGSGLMAGLGPSSSPRHWILSVPFQRIEAGGFIMGSPKSENNRVSDENQVQVQITKPFEIMTTEVTQLMWVKVMGYNPSSFNESKEDALHSLGCDDYEQGMCPNHPVEHVSWNKVQEFIRKLNDSLSLTSCDGTPSSAKGCYRLPTEAEWEYSAKAGTTTAYSFGDNLDNLGDYAWYASNEGYHTQKVGLKRANPWGLRDMHGNVWEWVQDLYASSLPGGADPLNTSGSAHVIRGGSFYSYARHLRSSNRDNIHPTYSFSSTVGFRLVRTL